VQPATTAGDELPEGDPCRPVVTQDTVGDRAADVEVQGVRVPAARAEHQAIGATKAAAQGRDKGAQELTRLAVVAGSAAPKASPAGGNVEVAVRPEDDPLGALQVATFGELVDERARGAIVAQDGLALTGAAELAGADVQLVVVRPEEDAVGLLQSATVHGDE